MDLAALVREIGDATQPLLSSIEQGESLFGLSLRRSARLPVAAAVWGESKKPILLLTDRSDRALTLVEELRLWAPDAPIMLFPEPAPLFYEDAAWGENTRRDRLNALTTLARYHVPGAPKAENPPVIIAPARAVMTRTMPRRDFLRASRPLHRGQVARPDDLARAWFSYGYQPVNTVIAPGQFARRGGLLDIWPPAEPEPVRIEFFGDEVDTLRRFNPSTQITVKRGGPLETILVTPAREYILPAEALENGPDTPGVSEFSIPLLHSFPASVLDYLPPHGLVLIDNHQAIADTVTEIEEQAVSLRADLIAEEALSPDFPTPYLSWSELEDVLSTHQFVSLGPPSIHYMEEVPEKSALSERFIPGPRFGGQLKPLMEHLYERSVNQEENLIISRQAARLKGLWDEQTRLLEQPPSGLRSPTFLEGSLAEGWTFEQWDGSPLHLLTDGEIFGWRRPEPRRRPRAVAEAPEAAYADLDVGDAVVHVDHGIGRYAGLVDRTVDGVQREYLAVEYAGEAYLYVPVHQADRITRYVGPDARDPELSRLGGTQWTSVKTHVRQAVQEVAEDLLELYARRSVVEGHTFAEDTPWQQELEASFPYIETDDQVEVLAEVKRDMESNRPMDRLICGDVGYGKTEVALRAAFKAVMDGKQVALLVPTTVLAQQHYNTFRERLAPFPLEVEMLSRFRTPGQQREIIDRMQKGQVDIVIGTHRLLSSDVDFKDMGLLIIDEEQRFGVTHKEALKKMRTEVDVLTLTATPIPRTLYMALSGVRDISTINTPPEERLPIVTHVGPYSKRLVRQAILREIERGGQVFFVHNRVQTIEAMRSHLERLVPEARITVAHGQMPEHELAQRMEQFTQGEVDVLLSTSIIESGLDIPAANTLIVDRADTFGLAQLYQLRGRVGRGAQRAYAYFFRHRRITPTPEARQRLETITENTQLGAGFSIAMRDLEIRGTGDILGTRQHGNIASVGFHLYTRMLAEAVRRLRRERELPETVVDAEVIPQIYSVNVELPLDVGIPASYVPDKRARLGLYRRIADLRSIPEVEALEEEFTDRFGLPPESVLNLLFQIKIKLMAHRAGLSSISIEAGQIVFRFPGGEPPDTLPRFDPPIRIGRTALWMPYAQLEDWRSHLMRVLDKLRSREGLQQEALL